MSGVPRTVVASLSVAPMRTPPTILSPTIVNCMLVSLYAVATLGGEHNNTRTASPAVSRDVTSRVCNFRRTISPGSLYEGRPSGNHLVRDQVVDRSDAGAFATSTDRSTDAKRDHVLV